MGRAACSAIFVDQLLDLTANSEPMLVVLMSIYYHDPTTKNRSLRVLRMRDWLHKKILSVVKPKNVDLFALHDKKSKRQLLQIHLYDYNQTLC